MNLGANLKIPVSLEILWHVGEVVFSFLSFLIYCVSWLGHVN